MAVQDIGIQVLSIMAIRHIGIQVRLPLPMVYFSSTLTEFLSRNMLTSVTIAPLSTSTTTACNSRCSPTDDTMQRDLTYLCMPTSYKGNTTTGYLGLFVGISLFVSSARTQAKWITLVILCMTTQLVVTAVGASIMLSRWRPWY